MPLAIRWSRFNKNNVAREENHYGVYELGYHDDILYIGEGQVYSRLMSHFSQSTDPIVGASYYRAEYTQSKERAVQRQNAELRSYERKHGRLPKFNQHMG